MAAEYINPQWRLPNEKTGNSSKYSMVSTAASRRIQVSGLANDLNITDQVTISGWMKPTDGVTQSNKYAFGFIGQSGNNGLDFGFHGSTCGSYANFSSSNYAYTNVAFNYSDGNWHHFVVSYNGSKHKIYIDGIFKAESSRTGDLVLGGDFYMFNTGTSNNNGATGELVDVCVFNYALPDGGVSVGSTATGQIADLYASTNPMALSSPPKAYYPLGSSAYTGSNYLTPNGALQDYVFNFSGANDRVYGPTGVFSGQTATTISFWVNIDDFSTTQNLFANGSYPYFRVMSNGTFNITWPVNGNNFQSFASGMTAGKWHLFVFKWESGSKYQIYIDNDLKGESTSTITGSFPSSNTDSLELANGVDNLDLQGKMSNFKVWNVALTTSELTTLYNYGSPIRTLASIPQSSNLKVWYKLDASEIYNNSSTDWNIDNNVYPSPYTSSLDFNGTSSYVNLSSNTFINTSSAFTISGWYKSDGIGSTGYNSTFAFKTNSTTSFIGYHNNASGYSPFCFGLPGSGTFKMDGGTIPSGWFHLCLVYDGNGIANTTSYTLYINNQSQSLTTAGGLSGPNNINRIGEYNSGNYFNGQISNMAVYNTALSAPNVETLYNNGTPQATIYGSPVAHWKLDNTTTGISDSSSPYSTSLKFNTTPADVDFVELGDLTTLATPATDFTFSMWLKVNNINSQNGRYAMVYSDKSGGIKLAPGGGISVKYEITMRGSSSLVTTPGSAEYTQWHHLAITLSGSSAKMYFNGVLVDTGTAGSATNFGEDAQMARLQSSKNSAFWGFEGSMSNFAIFNSELSASQVLTLYNLGSPEANTSFSPIHNWKLDNLTTGLNDVGSLASNNGTAGSYLGTAPLVELGNVSTSNGTNNGATEHTSFVNALAGDSSGMFQSNLVQSDLQTVAPYSKYAMSFDGNNYIDCGNDSSLKITSNFSVSAWVKSSDQKSFGVAVGNNSVFSLQMSDSLNQFRFNVFSGGWVAATYALNPIDDGKWHHVVGTHDGSTIKIYVDNVKGTDASAGAVGSNTQSFLIGYLPGNAGLYFDGEISNVSYWNTALTQTQITELYNEGLPSNLNSYSAYSNLVSWWQLGENSSYASGWTCLDEKGTNNGTSQNMLENAIANGVGTSGNGVSTNMGTATNISGSSPNGEGNSLSVNMTLANIASGVN